MKTEQYPPGMQTLANALRRLQADRRLVVCREDLLTYIDRHKRRASAESETDDYACTPWNGGAANSTRKVFKFLFKVFKVGPDRKFENFGKRQVDEDGFVRIFREEIQRATGLGSTAVGKALSRLKALEIIKRKHHYDDDTGHRHAWFQLSPAGIYTALEALPGFRVARDEVRVGRVRVKKTEEAPKVEVVATVEDHAEKPKKEQQTQPFSSSEPPTHPGQDSSQSGFGGAGVAGFGEKPKAGPGGAGPASAFAHCGNKKVAPAAPAEVFQPQEGNPAAQPSAQPARMSQQMIDNANNPRIQKTAEAARRAGMQLAPCGLDGGSPFLIPANRQVVFPKLNKNGFVFQPPPPGPIVPCARQPEPSPYPRVPDCPDLAVMSEHNLAPHAESPECFVECILAHHEVEALKVLIRVFDLTFEGMTDRQMKKFLAWVNHPTEDVRMSLSRLQGYAFHRDGQHNEKDWWLTCDLDFFLNAWHRIWKIVWSDEEVMSAISDDRFRLACIAYSRPEEFLKRQIQHAAEHLSQTRFVRPTVETSGWLLGPDKICDSSAHAALYMTHLRNPAIAPFMASTDANGVFTSMRYGFDVSGGPILGAKAALDSHLIVLLVESSRRKEHWPELDNDWVRQEARRMIKQSEPLRRVFEHFGVFSNYRDIGFISAATGAPHLVPGRDVDQIREHYDVQIEAARISKQRFELPFYGRLVSLADALEYSTWDGLDEVQSILKPFGYAF